MTQAQLARHMGVTVTTVARWEAIRAPRGAETLTSLSKVALEFGRTDLKEIFQREIMLQLGDLVLGILPMPADQPVAALRNALAHLEMANPFDAPRAVRAYRSVVRAIAAAHAQLYAELSKLPRKDPGYLSVLKDEQMVLGKIMDAQKRRSWMHRNDDESK